MEDWKPDKEDCVEKKSEYWMKAEQHSKLEVKILRGVRKFLKEKKAMDKLKLVEKDSDSSENDNRLGAALTYDIELNALIDKVFKGDETDKLDKIA